MEEETGFPNNPDNKNPLYALSQAQGITVVGSDCETVNVKQHSRSNSCDTNSGGKNGGTNSPNPGLTKPNAQQSQTINSGNSSPENSMRSKEMRSSMRQSLSEEGKDLQNVIICPKVNCPEKIIICLDVSQDMEKVTFRTRAGDKFAPMKLVKRALGLFLQSKHHIDRRHQFALVLLQETAIWMRDFTNDPEEILSILSDTERTFPCESFDIGSLYDVLHSQVPLPKIDSSDVSVLPPPYIVRALLIYGRSYCIPKLRSSEAQKELQKSPYFFLDAYYIHEPPSEENQCEAIFDQICELDDKGLAYVFEVSRNPTKLYDCMAQLLAHPLQRPLQKDVFYDIEPTKEASPQTQPS